MSDKCSFRELKPRSAMELLKEAEARQKKEQNKHDTKVSGDDVQ